MRNREGDVHATKGTFVSRWNTMMPPVDARPDLNARVGARGDRRTAATPRPTTRRCASGGTAYGEYRGTNACAAAGEWGA